MLIVSCQLHSLLIAKSSSTARAQASLSQALQPGSYNQGVSEIALVTDRLHEGAIESVLQVQLQLLQYLTWPNCLPFCLKLDLCGLTKVFH